MRYGSRCAEQEPGRSAHEGLHVAFASDAMQTPTTAQLRTAIGVLKKLGERIDNDAADSVMRLPDSRFGDHHAARIEARTLEQTEHIERVIAPLETWRNELDQQRKQCVSHHV